MRFLDSSFWSTRTKSFYARLILTRYTILYFAFALLSCVILVVLQSITLSANNAGVRALEGVISRSSVGKDRLPFLYDDGLDLCRGIPSSEDGVCELLVNFTSEVGDSPNITYVSFDARENRVGEDAVALASIPDVGILSDTCIYALRWLQDTLEDNIREDIVTICFQIWLVSLAFIALYNESIPHLGAGILSYILGTGWAAYRVRSSQKLSVIYSTLVVPQACSGIDLLGDWWNQRLTLAIAIITVNSILLAAILYPSYRLLKMYATQSFARVGTSEKILRIYKVVLFFSASLQLTAFFSLAATSVWVDKVSQGTIRTFARHWPLYLAAFIVTLVLLIPWLYLGWVCVRRECLRRYGVFCAISVFLVTLLTVLFFSPIYRFIFSTWSFFATITVTSYVCVVVAAILGILCRFNFGQGLARYLEVEEALAGVNFTSGTFSNNLHTKQASQSGLSFSLKRSGSNGRTNTEHHLILTKSKTRTSSIYSRSESDPIILSSTPADLESLVGLGHQQSESLGGTYYSSQQAQIIITRAVDIKEDPLPPIPVVKVNGKRNSKSHYLLRRTSQIPDRLSSLGSLRQALNQFPLPPSTPLPVATRYTAQVARPYRI